MANLPLTGSQYWGAALNNYLRQLNGDIAALKLRLDNFSVSASYSGSGWAESYYKISVDDANASYAELLDNNNAVYQLISGGAGYNATFKISGTLIFNNPDKGTSSAIAIPESQNMKITFGIGTDSDDLKVMHYLTYNSSTEKYEFHQRDKETLDVLMPNDGYYPIYAFSDSETGFRIALNQAQEFIFTANYILIGIALKANSKYFFARKTDSAFKTLYETRKGNLEAFASVINNEGSTARGIFQPVYTDKKQTGLKLLLSSAIIDYHSNGISMPGDEASKNDWDYKFPYDYKRFTGSGRNCYYVTTKTSGNTTTDSLTTFTTMDIELVDDKTTTSSSGLPVTKDNIYGIYISALGDIIIEATGNIDSAADLDNEGLTYDYIWDLNADSNFRTGGLVFLGAFYHGVNGWTYMHATSNGISPSFISSKSVENANIVKLPDVKYLAYETVEGKVGTPVAYKYEIKVPAKDETYTKDYRYLTINTAFDVATEDGYKYYNFFVAPSTFCKPIVSSNTYNGVRLGNLQISTPTKYSETPKWNLHTDDSLHGYSKFVSSTVTATHSSASLTSGYDNILENVELLGKVRLGESSTDNSTFSLNKRSIVDASGLSGGPDFTMSLVRNKDGSNLLLKGTESGSSATDTIISAVKNDNSLADLKIQGTNITLTASTGSINLESNKVINVGNTLRFTSDRRCKENIKDLSTEVCVDLVKKLKAKSFIYKDNQSASMGIIAQELEDLCPEYKDILVGIQPTAELPDKKTVAETKLLFVLWEAVQYLLNRGE
jgi:hypothetical protein